ncbi:hypothetical protein SAMN02927900_00753 [Rhizobium mongolense subsp. loessense]|uniref:Uncharacterized protein n=1 Tax=Rhizobium mongolense subsp. loessense TaxID=158890 RepID=A0A1G4PN32_9HYPH|nr:hypothetical protein [Rhizobium mongolense]SCW33667.1 hypothetical protein SAMN02927900_00753 [Rhizobium mongolense subsp. loessense]
MIEQIMIANFLGLSQNCRPIQKRERTEDDFYRDLGSSPFVSFTAWLTSISLNKQKERALPARSSIPSSCKPDQAARLARP